MASELAEAVAKVQSDLPRITKGETAKVETKGGGSYSYTYADLASVSEALLPRLAEYQLAFICKPTLDDEGRFGLAYSLVHVSGEREDGFYPLPSTGTPQQVGSAITYARRYVLCAVTGVAPDDDDGQAAEQAAREAPAPAPRQSRASSEKPDAAKRVQDAMAKAGVPLGKLTAYVKAEHGVDGFLSLDPSMQESVATGITKGVLLDDIKGYPEVAS